MGALIFSAVSLFATSMLARVLIGGGLALLVSAGLGVVVNNLLASVVSTIGGLPDVAYQLFLLGGAGHAIAIIGGAMITRAALYAAGRVLGITMGGGA